VLYAFSLIDFPDLSQFSHCRFSCSRHRLCFGLDPTHSSWTVLLGSLYLESLVTSVQSAALSAANVESILVLCLLISVCLCCDFLGSPWSVAGLSSRWGIFFVVFVWRLVRAVIQLPD
jgi:hypothetical protein